MKENVIFAFKKKHTAMAKNKKKVQSHAQQKLQAVQHKKQYMERLRKFCTIIGCGKPLFDLLPPYAREAVYDNRGTTPKIRVEKGAKITKRLVRIMYAHMEKEIKSKMMELMIPDMPHYVNLTDYYQLVLPLEGVLASGPPFRGKEHFDAFCLRMDDRYAKYYTDLGYIIHCACFAYCDLSKRAMYTFKFDVERASTVVGHKTRTGLFRQIITLGLYPLDIRYVTIHGDRRPVVQTGEVKHKDNVSEFVPTTVPLKRLHVKDPTGHAEIPVYVQQHAVDRTMQRACCVFPGSVLSLINQAFTHERKIIRESGDRYLVECYLYEIKIGYFVGMLIDGIFVIRTFLLLTHSGTPEGRKLTELTGLQRSDISFLNIDDLKTLINSDIADDERIAQIFVDAGCESILKMNFQLSIGEYDWLWDDAKQESELSKLIAEYIRLGDTDEEYFENE
jgi:hypothetical protein